MPVIFTIILFLVKFNFFYFIFRFGARNGDRNARIVQRTWPSNVWRHFLFIPRWSQRGQFARTLRARRRQYELHRPSCPQSSLRTGYLHRTHWESISKLQSSQAFPGPPFVFGAALVVCALLVAYFIPEDNSAMGNNLSSRRHSGSYWILLAMLVNYCWPIAGRRVSKSKPVEGCDTNI